MADPSRRIFIIFIFTLIFIDQALLDSCFPGSCVRFAVKGTHKVAKCPIIVGLRGGSDHDEDEPEQPRDGSGHDKALINQLQTMRSECNEVAEKISSLEQERDDHEMVASILAGFAPSRRCYRSVGGILMERTVGHVVPEIRNETGMLTRALGDLSKGLVERQRAMEAFQAEHSIRVVRGDADGMGDRIA